jgi:hemoglobin
MLRFHCFAVALLGLAVGSGLSRADDALAFGQLDAKLRDACLQTTLRGTSLFNAGDQVGCLRLYEGTLTVVAPLLDHRPDLSEAVKAHIRKAETLNSTSDKAFELRAALDKVMAIGSKKPLWERLGGEPAVRAVVHDFVVRTAGNPKVNFTRDGQFPVDAAGVKKLEQLLVELISATTGGPLKYTGRSMKESHQGMKITEAEFNAMAGDLIATLKKFQVPQAEIDELIGIVATTKPDIVGQ